ncbi:L-serine ammonia-lyase [Alginatibacterium sediminis]|uniref:L-serine dehydratase n=1 Tax=Alginatibacterium sediminis TaxID=2164068 RepID=A0A420EGE0_9ALTE|nr:L-serine ammonia-lyase [Alginatibacterium sediminis]RKF19730.1 L-serine ammonia-lyase [Alginatibacterium sediminis]
MISVFDLFSIGIGPSSSHTVGPMLAAHRLVNELSEQGKLARIKNLRVELYGSLGATGKGHGSGKAIILGLLGEHPQSIDINQVDTLLLEVERDQKLRLNSSHIIDFPKHGAILFEHKTTLEEHSNGLRFFIEFDDGECLEKTYFSVGGGYITEQGIVVETNQYQAVNPYSSAKQLLEICQEQGKSIAALVEENERCAHSQEQIDQYIASIWLTMQDSVKRGMTTEGILPGGLRLARRAPTLARQLRAGQSLSQDPLNVLDWVNLFALSVSEENAAGSRVVTAPTNGAAGVIPAVLQYYHQFVEPLSPETCKVFFLTATAIGSLYKLNASISGAEVGCQGEVGVACSMAAAGLAAIFGASPQQIENAAEIGMEHNLGLTCDPIGGLVQVPCIERNAMGAMKAINASRLALRGSGDHKVSLDKVIRTMWQTGCDMQSNYKETSRGGLAVNIIEC